MMLTAPEIQITEVTKRNGFRRRLSRLNLDSGSTLRSSRRDRRPTFGGMETVLATASAGRMRLREPEDSATAMRPSRMKAAVLSANTKPLNICV